MSGDHCDMAEVATCIITPASSTFFHRETMFMEYSDDRFGELEVCLHMTTSTHDGQGACRTIPLSWCPSSYHLSFCHVLSLIVTLHLLGQREIGVP